MRWVNALGRLRAADELLELVQRSSRGAAGGQRGDGDGTGHRQCRKAGCHDQAAQVQGAGLRSARAESVSGIVHVIRFLLTDATSKVAAGATVAGLLGVLLMTGCG
jgi:hypothetical protein